MYVVLALVLAVQQWTVPVRVSPDTLSGTHSSVVAGCWGGTWVCWYSSGYLWSRSYEEGRWSEPILVDSTKCRSPEVTTSSMCRDGDGNAVVAWVDTSHCVRLSTCRIRKDTWVTSPPDLRITGENPAIVSDTAGNIWCAWTMLDTSGAELCYQASYHDGSEWATPVWLERIVPVEISYTTGITADHRNNIWVSYNDHEVVWVKCWDGSSWSEAESIGTCFDHACPTMCADSFEVWVSWFDFFANMGYGGIFARYHDGVEWSDSLEFPHAILHDQGWHNWHADLCLDDQRRLWAGWWETAGIYTHNYSILGSYYERNVWDEVSWVDTCIGAWGGHPSIAYGDGEVWMVWQSEKEGGFGIYNIYLSHCELTAIEDAVPTATERPLAIESYPNPLRTCASISWYLLSDSEVRLTIYSIQGELIWTGLSQGQETDLHTIIWNATDNSGHKVPSGTYFLRLEAHTPRSVWTGLTTGSYTATRKLCVVR